MSKAVSARKRRQKERMRERVAAPPFGLVRVNPSALVPNASYSVQPFVQTGYYEDRPFVCKDCGCAEIWRATQQKWWFEIAKGGQDSVAVHCRPCRRKRQATRATARAQAVTHYGEFALRRLLLDGSLKVEKWRPRVRAIQKLIAAGLGERFGHYDAARNPDVETLPSTMPTPSWSLRGASARLLAVVCCLRRVVGMAPPARALCGCQCAAMCGAKGSAARCLTNWLVTRGAWAIAK